ncbi:OmpH family outer membrane protein [Draconibacterium sp. IB214405]|uniref:OmpH family outer membrane protein n=1 Tax=Draconibacterium sp. IB214405 TaxID=3097352 RepID=UPI002A0FB86D|nr:OmpH family outer membrane protein [Draconibacterium sp. IB214405]MDX8340499.1 OmpH family outer membrane protein [Draconibacterium sp. IB214405]
MKGTSLVVSVVLFVAVIVLYVLHFTSGSTGSTSQIKAAIGVSGDGLKIAYIKADSVILNYNLSADLHDEFAKKQEAYTTEYGTKRQSFEKEAAAFQEKLQRGGFLTEQRAVQERDRLLGKEQEIQKLDQELSTKLAEIQQTNNNKILDNLMDYLNEYNEIAGYDFILNGSNVLIGPDANNITGEVLKALNEQYEKAKAE